MNTDETSSEVKSSKKQEMKQKRAILTQFDKIATSYQSKKSDVGKDSTITTRDGT